MFLCTQDYNIEIQSTQLLQLTHNNITTRYAAESRAVEDISEYLRQKYDVDTAFASIIPYTSSGTYFGNNLVQLTGTTWASGVFTSGQTVVYTDGYVYLCILNTDLAWVAQNYVVNNIVLWTDGNYYKCILNTTTDQNPTNATYWEATTSENPGNTTFWLSLGVNNSFYYLKYPYPVFDVNCYYQPGQKVFWKGNIYQCILPTSQLSHTLRIQYNWTTEYPLKNTFPDDLNEGVYQWGTGVPYSMTGVIINAALPSAYNPGATYAIGNTVLTGTQIWQSLTNGNIGNTPGTGITFWQPVTWVSGDNRNSKLVEMTINFTLFYLHSNIAPNNIPMVRIENWKKACRWCEDIKEGVKVVNIATMPVLQPPQGNRILLGSAPKRNNFWG